MGAQGRAKQTEFRWSYLQRKTWINDAAIPRGVSNDGRGVSSAAMTAILHKINDHYGENQTAWPSQDLIASCSKFSTRTVKRAIQALERLSLLVKEQQRRPEGGYRNIYRIVWTELQLLNPETRTTQQHGDTVSKHSDTMSKHGDMVSKHGDTVSPEQLTNNSRTIQRTTHSARDRRRDPIPVGWVTVVKSLEEAGMSDSRGAVTAAQSRELTPADVSGLVERWERLRARQPHVTVGWLYRWINGDSSPPSDQEIDRLEASHQVLACEQQKREIESIRTRVIREGRRRRKSESEIMQVLEHALRRKGFTAEADQIGEEVAHVG